MKNMRWALVGGIVLLICMAAVASPAVASTSGTTTISGTIPLKICNVQASCITDHTATICWTTNGAATSQVFYDTIGPGHYRYSTPVDSTPVIKHCVKLTGLKPCTTYHYMAKSVAIIGGVELVAVSADFTFTTLRAYSAPSVTTLAASPVYSTRATLWGSLGNKGSASYVQVYFQWGKDKTYGSETSHKTLTSAPRAFSALVTSLTPNTTYHFRAVAAGDGITYGQDQVFRTMPWPIIRIVGPRGGERWEAGSHHTFTWTCVNGSGDVKIELLRGGVVDRVICDRAPAGDDGNGSFSWAVPSSQPAGTDYEIRITSLSEPDCTATSNDKLTISRAKHGFPGDLFTRGLWGFFGTVTLPSGFRRRKSSFR